MRAEFIIRKRGRYDDCRRPSLILFPRPWHDGNPAIEIFKLYLAYREYFQRISPKVSEVYFIKMNRLAQAALSRVLDGFGLGYVEELSLLSNDDNKLDRAVYVQHLSEGNHLRDEMLSFQRQTFLDPAVTQFFSTMNGWRADFFQRISVPHSFFKTQCREIKLDSPKPLQESILPPLKRVPSAVPAAQRPSRFAEKKAASSGRPPEEPAVVVARGASLPPIDHARPARHRVISLRELAAYNRANAARHPLSLPPLCSGDSHRPR